MIKLDQTSNLGTVFFAQTHMAMPDYLDLFFDWVERIHSRFSWKTSARSLECLTFGKAHGLTKADHKIAGHLVHCIVV